MSFLSRCNEWDLEIRAVKGKLSSQSFAESQLHLGKTYRMALRYSSLSRDWRSCCSKTVEVAYNPLAPYSLPFPSPLFIFASGSRKFQAALIYAVLSTSLAGTSGAAERKHLRELFVVAATPARRSVHWVHRCSFACRVTRREPDRVNKSSNPAKRPQRQRQVSARGK